MNRISDEVAELISKAADRAGLRIDRVTDDGRAHTFTARRNEGVLVSPRDPIPLPASEPEDPTP